MNKLLYRNIFLFKIEAVFFGLTQVWAPVFVIYQMTGIGLSLPEVLIGETVLAASSFTFELPSGILADLLGRKRTLLLQSLVMLACIAVFLSSTSLLGVIFAQILLGLSMALQSGTDESLFFDTLKNLKKENLHKEMIGANRSIMQTFTFLGTIFAGFFANINISLPLIIAAITTTSILVTRLFMVEAKYEFEEKNPIKHLFKAFKFTFVHKKIRNILFFFGIIATTSIMLFNTLNPLFELKLVPIWAFGILFASFSLLSAITTKYAHKIEKKLGVKNSIILIYLVSILGFILLWGLELGILAAIIFPGIIRSNNSFADIIIGDAIHNETDSHHRATVMSIKGAIIAIMSFLMMPALAAATNFFGLINIYGLIALFIFIFAGIFLKQIRVQE